MVCETGPALIQIFCRTLVPKVLGLVEMPENRIYKLFFQFLDRKELILSDLFKHLFGARLKLLFGMLYINF